MAVSIITSSAARKSARWLYVMIYNYKHHLLSNLISAKTC